MISAPDKLSPRNRRALDRITVIARWFVGIVFIYMGLTKGLDPVEFLKIMRQYDLTTNPLLLNSIAAALPWFEVFCGLLLVAGIAVRGVALNIIAMLVPFTIIVLKRALALATEQHLPFCAVRFDCGCGTGEVIICQKLTENCALLFLSCWLLSGYGRQLCLRFGLLGKAADSASPVPAPTATSEFAG